MPWMPAMNRVNEVGAIPRAEGSGFRKFPDERIIPGADCNGGGVAVSSIKVM
jgi:hypothetical protein